MRSRSIPLILSLYLALSVLGCTSKPAADNNSSPDTSNNASNTTSPGNSAQEPKDHREHKEAREEKKKAPVVVPAGTSITVSLGSAIGSKLSQAGQSFSGTVAKDIMVGNEVVIPKGSAVTGTVTDAKPLGRFAGGAVLTIRLDSLNLNGYNAQLQTEAKTFSAKGKGKRTGVMAGGGAALGGIIGGLAGGGKGAAIGLLAGGGAGAGGAALTGNKDIVLPAESDVTFELSQPLELQRM